MWGRGEGSLCSFSIHLALNSHNTSAPLSGGGFFPLGKKLPILQERWIWQKMELLSHDSWCFGAFLVWAVSLQQAFRGGLSRLQPLRGMVFGVGREGRLRGKNHFKLGASPRCVVRGTLGVFPQSPFASGLLLSS